MGDLCSWAHRRQGIRDRDERPAKRRRLEAEPSPSIGKKGKKSNLDDEANKKPAQVDKDFEEYQKVMQLRTGKGPSWVNEPQLRPQTPVKKLDKVGSKDDQMDDGPTPSQDGLSDLEWMKQRMAKSKAEGSDTAAGSMNPPPAVKADANQARPYDMVHFAPRHLTRLEIARSLLRRSSARHHSQNRSALCPEPRLLLHRRRSEGVVQTFRGNITGLSPIPSAILKMLTGEPVFPAGETTFLTSFSR